MKLTFIRTHLQWHSDRSYCEPVRSNFAGIRLSLGTRCSKIRETLSCENSSCFHLKWHITGRRVQVNKNLVHGEPSDEEVSVVISSMLESVSMTDKVPIFHDRSRKHNSCLVSGHHLEMCWIIKAKLRRCCTAPHYARLVRLWPSSLVSVNIRFAFQITK